jgi:hypothetical protein
VIATEVLVCLIRSHLELRLIAFSRTEARLGVRMRETSWRLSDSEEAVAREVRLVVRAVAERLPWTSTCLVRAMAARALLARRRLPCTLYLGLRHPAPSLEAHAWLRAGSISVTGGAESRAFHPVVWFGSPTAVPPGSRE